MKKILIMVFSIALLISCSEDRKENTVTTSDNKMPSIKSDYDSETIEKYKGAVIKTNMGNIEIEFYNNSAPITVDNFIKYVQSGFYKNTIFHRVIKDFMVQGGGFNVSMMKKNGEFPPIKNEADNGINNDRGTLAMARTGVVDSATSQFFINHRDNTFLNNGVRDFGYCVFAKVTKGMNVVDKIANTPTANMGQFQNVPKKMIVISDIELIEFADK